MPSNKAAPPDFEHALAELEGLVARLESGELSLEQALAQFERGVELTRACQQALQQAELKVEQLLQQGAEETTAPFAEGE